TSSTSVTACCRRPTRTCSRASSRWCTRCRGADLPRGPAPTSPLGHRPSAVAEEAVRGDRQRPLVCGAAVPAQDRRLVLLGDLLALEVVVDRHVGDAERLLVGQ